MNILINQLGYTPSMRKVAVLRGCPGTDMQVRDAQGETVLTVPVSAGRTEIWGDDAATADFSALKREGVYTLHSGGESSRPFRVAQEPYQACLTALVDMFHYQRCGSDMDARTGVFRHPPCHTGLARVYGTQELRDVHGGWHDAGDYGRYVVPAAKAVADLLMAWQWNREAFAQPGLSPLMAEVRWELEWLLRMQREDGGVYHKVSCARFCPMIMPHEEQEELILSPVSTTATADFAACMALASRVYAQEDAAFAGQMLAAARRAWDFLAGQEPLLFRNPEGISTGGYGDRSDADERLWADAELALTTGEETYLAAMRQALVQQDPTRAPLGWADVSGYAALAGLQLPGEIAAQCRQWLLQAADAALARLNRYGITMTDHLPWGSNMIVANDGMIFLMAWRLTGEACYREAAERQVHYLLGVNPVDCCYVSGFGSSPMRHPHHRPSVATGVCQPGMLSGGAASGLMDPVARECLLGKSAGKSFIDHHGSYSTNEICIYWNSPLVALLAGLSA